MKVRGGGGGEVNDREQKPPPVRDHALAPLNQMSTFDRGGILVMRYSVSGNVQQTPPG